MPMMLALDEDLEESIQGWDPDASWDEKMTGTIVHKGGTALSETKGITVEGTTYDLKPADIELEETGLGAGACGQVKKGVIKATNTPVAVKGIKIDDNEKKKMLLAELRNLVAAERCPFLVTWYGGFVTRSIVHVVLELCDLGSLRTLSNRAKRAGDPRIPPCHLALITKSSVSGLSFLHDIKIVHRDIKPDNILHNSRGEVKITDFGISRSLDATIAMAETQIGTQLYMAPEMVMGEEYTFGVDIWSFGLVLYELATGDFPLKGSTIPELFEALMELPEPRLNAEEFPPDLCDVVAQCLTREWEKRGDTQNLLKKPFLADVESNETFAEYLATFSS